MKILYAIQGTGNGHVTRAMEIVPILQKKGNVDVLLSGIQSDLKLPFEIKYKYIGLSFIFGKDGGVDIWQTYLRMNSLRLLREIKSLPVNDYDLIISDFEPVSCWAAQLARKPVVGLSNQVATLHPRAPRPKSKDVIGKIVLERYAPATYHYGFHFKSLDNHIYTPIIRKEVRNINITNKKHITVYLPSYSDEKIIRQLKKFKKIKWDVFSKYNLKKESYKNITIQPLDASGFLESMASSNGVLCNAGFGTTSEALFLGKKLMVIPMKTQYEQHCNAAMLKSMGVHVMKKLKTKYHDKLEDWLMKGNSIDVEYPDITESILDTIIANHAGETSSTFVSHGYSIFQ